MWGEYMENRGNFDFINYLKNRNFTLKQVYINGHASRTDYKNMVEVIEPKYIVPNHTFEVDKYQEIFDYLIVKHQYWKFLEIISFSLIY